MTSVHIHITQVALRAMVGVRPAERRCQQQLISNLVLELPPRPPTASDNLASTVDYDQIVAAMHDYALSARPQLLETFGNGMIDRIFAQDARIVAVTLTLHKPEARTDARIAMRLHKARPL